MIIKIYNSQRLYIRHMYISQGNKSPGEGTDFSVASPRLGIQVDEGREPDIGLMSSVPLQDPPGPPNPEIPSSMFHIRQKYTSAIQTCNEIKDYQMT